MKNIPKNPFILVDGSSYLFRAYHALPPLTTSKGQPTGAIYGVVNMLKRLIKDYNPEKMVVVFDSKEKNFRHKIYEPYKANRLSMPEELQSQIEPLFALIRAMGLPLLVIPGVEADDIIGTLARVAKAEGLFSLISTGDKDFAQLVDDNTYLINTMSQDIFDRARVIEKFEVTPEQIIDYLTLIGDSVDNIPGVPKVGPKTAVKWLQTYGNLANIMERAGDISGVVGENLRNTSDKLPMFQSLVTIDINLPIEKNLQDFLIALPKKETLQQIYTELEFKTWLRDLVEGKDSAERKENLPQTKVSGSPLEDTANRSEISHYPIILEKSQLDNWLKKIRENKLFAFSIASTSPAYMAAEMVGFSFALKTGEAAYLPFGHNYEGVANQLSREVVLEALKSILEDETIVKIGHNIKYDSEVLLNHGILLRGCYFDTMLASYVLDSAGTKHSIEALALKYLDYPALTYETVAGKGAKQLPFQKVEIEPAAAYVAEMSDITLQLYTVLNDKLSALPSLKTVFDTIEMPLVFVLVAMERLGVLIDSQALLQQGTALALRLNELQTEAETLSGKTFNLNSPKQLQEILFVDLKLQILEKTPTGQPSTAESVLQELALKYPLPKVVLEYRSLSKLKSTYIDALPEQIDPNTGRVHTCYHQAITSTGRLSSSDPNLQNIPIRTEEGRKIRCAFIAPKKYKIVTADYSQIELRLMAHMSQDEALVNAFNKK